MSNSIKYRGFRLRAPGTRVHNGNANKVWYAVGRINGRQHEYSLKHTDIEVAKAILDGIIENKRRRSDEFCWPDDAAPKWAKRLLDGAKWRSGKGGITFSLTLDDIKHMADRAGGRCEVSGVPFCGDNSCGKRRPFAPSIDRKVPEDGYVPENCRLVCFAVNVALSDWGEDVLNRVASGVIANSRSRGVHAGD